MKNKNHTIISTDAEKAFDKNQHPIMIKSFNKFCIEETYLKILRPYMTNPQATSYSMAKS